jgi:hypothetical protein
MAIVVWTTVRRHAVATTAVAVAAAVTVAAAITVAAPRIIATTVAVTSTSVIHAAAASRVVAAAPVVRAVGVTTAASGSAPARALDRPIVRRVCHSHSQRAVLVTTRSSRKRSKELSTRAEQSALRWVLGGTSSKGTVTRVVAGPGIAVLLIPLGIMRAAAAAAVACNQGPLIIHRSMTMH